MVVEATVFIGPFGCVGWRVRGSEVLWIPYERGRGACSRAVLLKSRSRREQVASGIYRCRFRWCDGFYV
eukprot:6190621-Pleurochrysis_carterae.AAC.1